MKKLVLLVAVLGACSSNDDGGGGGGGGADAFVTAKWDFKSIDGTPLQCPTGFGTTALYSQEIDAAGANIGAPVIDLFDCNAFQGTSDALDQTTYYSWVQIQNTDGSSTYASSPEAFVDLTANDATFTANIYDDAGYFQLAWQLQDGGSNTTCAANPDITGVEAISTEIGNSSNSASDIFHCGDHFGITDALPAGDYTISVDAFNASMAAVGTADPVTNTIKDRNRVTDLGTITIPLD
ncbi:MAG TPA: hypothetical protein VGC41_15420 [Kofleriaceae bacterium]